MFSCAEITKACGNISQPPAPQQVTSQQPQFRPPQRQEQQPAFAVPAQLPTVPAQSVYPAPEQKAVAPPQDQNYAPEVCAVVEPPAPLAPESQVTDFGVAPEDEKPPAEPLELGPAYPPTTYQLPVVEEQPKAWNNVPVAQPPPQQQLVPQPPKGPDLKEPEPEETVEYNAAYEQKKAMISCCAVLTVWGGVLALLMIRPGFEAPFCEDEDVLKLAGKDVPKSCEPCGSGTIVIPLGGEWEKDWPKAVRAVLYFMGLGWCFLGIAIVCDQFMAAIEEVTSKTVVVWRKVHGDTKHKFHRKVWNDTVANLTLMALGSSAPEILLSVIELVGNSFFAGELGPSTIVGSAAFNLLVITAVCVAAIPAPETRKIDMVPVFAVTASLSVFAYAWLIVILQLMTPDVVTTTEAIVTFAFFPMLVIIAFLADKGYLGGCSKSAGSDDSHITNEQDRLQKLYKKTLSFETVKMMMDSAQSEQPAQLTKAQRRRLMMKSMIGGGQTAGLAEVTVGFAQKKYITLECAVQLDIPVKISQRQESSVEVRYFTQEGSALAGKRYTHTEGSLSFKPNELEKMISIPIIDNEVWEEQEDFTVCLQDLTADGQPPSDKLGYGIRTTNVIILNDDEPGTLCFFVDEVKASRDADTIQVGISRINGSTGRITCSYATEDNTAIAGSNYTAVEGQLAFEEGVCKASLEISIAPLGQARSDRSFRVVLTNASEGAKFDAERDGGTERALCEVILPGVQKGALAQYLSVCSCNMKLTQSMPDWKDQVISAMYCNGTAADQSTATRTDWIFHLLSVFWKIVFSLIPPAPVAGGWACFCVALAMIGGVTMIVGDMAALMGCCMGIPDDITAITIVALGTSLPDTFASKSAAQHDPTADNSIGNVTGSNCVNVFLGLGMPWTVGALYWGKMGKTADWIKKDFKDDNYEKTWGSKCPDGCFLVPAGGLTFSVTVFTITALTCIGLLVVRRQLYGGELGGPSFASKRDAVILVCLWMVYIVASILKSLKVI